MLIKNKTHYFNTYTKVYNIVPDTHSFEYESSRRMGYYQRLYYEYLYNKSVNGQTFFYTLTYNDRSIPYYLGKPVFSYKHIRYVTNGSLSKTLLRKYGTKLKYFCACERGDGKGSRGLGNNPHYHFIFYLYPANDSYKPINPVEFRSLLRFLWMGTDKYVDFKSAKFGICKEGDNLGVVTSPEAFRYVGKYCIKDSVDYEYENFVYKHFANEVSKSSITYGVLYTYYKYLNELKLNFTREDFFRMFNLHDWKYNRSSMTFSQFLLNSTYDDVKVHVFELFQWFDSWYKDYYCRWRVNEYRSLYSGKVRMSKSLGEYGLNFVQLVNGKPKLVMNDSRGYQTVCPCLYYIRHLYYNVITCPVTGNPLYRLNERGIELRVSNIIRDVQSFSVDVDTALHSSLSSGLIPDASLKERLSSLLNNDSYDNIVYRFCLYRLVYQYRSYDNLFFPSSLTSSFSSESIESDYRRFLKFQVSIFDFDDNYVFNCHRLQRDGMFTSFDSHPVFKDYLDFFSFIADIYDYYVSFRSDRKREDFTASSAHLKRINSYKINSSIGSL